jgi:hypothetical protein
MSDRYVQEWIQGIFDMPQEKVDFAWNLMVELRKELVETQRIRSQVIGFKITFVSTAIGVIAANLDKVSLQLLVIPAFAAIFFDLLINSYGYSIKRIGFYCRNYIEPNLKTMLVDSSNWLAEMPLWEEFLAKDKFRQNLGLWGNLGITGLAVVVAVIALVIQFDWQFSTPLLIILAISFIYDVAAFLRTDKRSYTRSLVKESQRIEPSKSTGAN